MLTKEDLLQIRNIVVDSEIRIKTELRTELASKSDLSELKLEIKNELKTMRRHFSAEISRVWEELREIRGALNGAIRYFDQEIIKIKPI